MAGAIYRRLAAMVQSRYHCDLAVQQGSVRRGGDAGARSYASNSFQYPSEMISTESSTILMAVCSSMA